MEVFKLQNVAKHAFPFFYKNEGLVETTQIKRSPTL